MPLKLNQTLQQLDIYASKAIALEAKRNPDIANLSFGEPEFGPPQHMLDTIVQDGLSLDKFLHSVKRYEDPKGSLSLRQAISEWYASRYNLKVDPENEIIVTHGGVEAIALAILCVAEQDESIAVTDPSYMLYRRAIQTLGRKPVSLTRPLAQHEYDACFTQDNHELLNQPYKAIIINSPENPSGYVLSDLDWKVVEQEVQKSESWVIHDEVYDTMSFNREHKPVRSFSNLKERSILINSCSKKFGMPGLRIGWMVADKHVINLASKIHDYLYLGVNIQYEAIAELLLKDERTSIWLSDVCSNIAQRALAAQKQLTAEAGFLWPRKPYGAMFVFPEISNLYEALSRSNSPVNDSISVAVSKYLLHEVGVAAVPGNVYGPSSDKFIRLVLCSQQAVFDTAMQKCQALSGIVG